MQPQLAVGDGLGGFDHPDPGCAAIDHNCAPSELLAQGDLATGTHLFHNLLADVQAGGS